MKTEQSNFRNYIYDSFDRICDLTPLNQLKLNNLLTRIYADYYDVEMFMEAFGFEKRDFIQFYNFITNHDTFVDVVKFGYQCYQNAEQKKLLH